MKVIHTHISKVIDPLQRSKFLQIGPHGRILPPAQYRLSMDPSPCRMLGVRRELCKYHGCETIWYQCLHSGAEGTIIEEHDNVAQMIWGLAPDDQPHNPIRAEGFSSHPDNSQNALLHGSTQFPPRVQKKRTPVHQIPKLSRTQISSHTSHPKPDLSLTQRQVYDDKRNFMCHVSSDIETHQDTVSELPWTEGQSMPASVGVPEKLVNDSDGFPVDNNRTLEWQLARLRHALRSSLVDMDSYDTYPGRLEPVIPAAVAPGFPQSYPRIFVEPRPNESINPGTRQSPIELAQQYRQQQLYRQALRKQKPQVQCLLPTPPNSSSPQWSSQFSPYLTYCSTSSPELVDSSEHPVSAPSRNFRSGVNASQYLRHVYDRHERDSVNDFDTSTNISSTKTPPTVPNVNSAVSLRQNSSSASTLAKYIKQLQALSPIAHFSPLQPIPPPNGLLAPLPSTDDGTVGPFRSVYHSPVVPTPPSPESPPTLFRGSSYHNARSMPQTRPMQRRLPSVPEEDSAVLELSTSVSPSRLPSQVTTHGSSSSHDGMTGHQIRYLAVPVPHVDMTRKTVIPDLPEFESNSEAPTITFHETSPVKVRLPVNKEQGIREQANRKEGHQHGHRKKHRFKKPKGSTATNEQGPTRGPVG